MIKKLLRGVLWALLLCSLTACGPEQQPPSQTQPSQKMPVAVSFNAMRELAQAIGGDKVEIHTIIPDGAEPHDFEPKASDLTALSQARVFIINGLGVEDSWADKAVRAAGNKDLVMTTASDGADIITEHRTSSFLHKETPPAADPHLWLSLKGAKTESRTICDAFCQADPENAAYYEGNYETFSHQLDALHEKYAEKFQTVAKKDFITGHAAFSYTARDFGLTQNSLENVFAAGEPSARRLKELADYSRAHHIKVIFVEDMESPKISETLAREVGASVDEICTLESAEPGKDYLGTMQENLEKIYQSLV